MIRFAIEFNDVDASAYGKVHVAGCRDLVDPEEFDAEPTLAEVRSGASNASGWEDEEFQLSPCARKLVRS